jgi:hypothetical protein
VRFAYARALQRRPSAAESRVLAGLLKKARAEFRADPQSARKLVAVGLAAPPPPTAAAEVAAWTQVSRAILNLPEVITRP